MPDLRRIIGCSDPNCAQCEADLAAVSQALANTPDAGYYRCIVCDTEFMFLESFDRHREVAGHDYRVKKQRKR